jgi:hypothetical protein
MTLTARTWLRGGRADLVVAACALAFLCRSLCVAMAAPGDGVELVPPEISLGAVPEGDERVIRLTVSNRRSTPADVVVVPSCTCTTPETGPIALGGFANVTFPVRVTTARRPGYNVAHVQIAGPSGSILGQSRITFTAVRAWVFEPPVLFLKGGDERAAATAWCLAPSTPGALEAAADDPAVTARADRIGARAAARKARRSRG